MGEAPENRIAREAQQLDAEWKSARWSGVRRDYSAADVLRLRGSLKLEYTLATLGAERLWEQLNAKSGEPVRTFGAHRR